MTEPTITALGGRAPSQIARRLFLATRPKFFTASVLPLILGSLWGAIQAGSIDAVAFILSLAAIVFVHAAANVLNDVYDDLTGNDGPNEGRIYPYTGGSRFIQNGIMDVGQMARWGWLLLALGLGSGLALIAYKGLMVAAFGVIGVALAVLYSAPPVRLSGRGLGEIAVGIAFGVLPIMGAVWLQTGMLTADALLISLPTSFWVVAILMINEVPDVKADEASGRQTLAVKLGKAGSRWFYVGLLAAGLAAVGLIADRGLLPVWCLILPAALTVLGVKGSAAIALETADPAPLRKAIEGTLGIHALGTIWLIAVGGASLWLAS